DVEGDGVDHCRSCWHRILLAGVLTPTSRLSLRHFDRTSGSDLPGVSPFHPDVRDEELAAPRNAVEGGLLTVSGEHDRDVVAIRSCFDLDDFEAHDIVDRERIEPLLTCRSTLAGGRVSIFRSQNAFEGPQVFALSGFHPDALTIIKLAIRCGHRALPF